VIPDGVAVAAEDAEAFEATDLPPPDSAWMLSISLRTTGASTVEDAERTNSPSS
jgi:hypothetical protein